MDEEERIYLECTCGQSDHRVVFSLNFYEVEDEPPDLYIETCLWTPSFWRRLIVAFWYVLGRRCRYGNFSETVLHPKDAHRLRDMLDKFIKLSIR